MAAHDMSEHLWPATSQLQRSSGRNCAILGPHAYLALRYAISGTGGSGMGMTAFRGLSGASPGGPPLGVRGRPAPEVLEDAPHHARIVDQRDHAHRACTFGTDEPIGFADLADEPCPGCLGAAGEPACGFEICCGLGQTDRSGQDNLGLQGRMVRSGIRSHGKY